MTLRIDADFDGGNIEVVSAGEETADLTIRRDTNGPWFQWFYFRVAGAKRKRLTLRILNAGESAYPEGWPCYRACVSTDNADWVRAETAYADGVLEIRYPAEADTIWFAYFAPYGQDRLGLFLNAAAATPGVSVREIGRSVENRPLHCVEMGEGPRQVWLVGRQHAGETMASWWMDGALGRLTDPDDAVGRALREAASVHIVPLVNVDGAARGHLRGNVAGLDLNRQWHAPDPERAPEVAAVLAAMDRTGVDLSLDVHGDETLPHVFVDGCDMDPKATPAQVEGVARFKTALLKASPAFQTAVGYAASYGGDEAPGMCNRALGRRFAAIGLTLEMPFKDSLERPDPVLGWSAQASAELGRRTLAAILDTIV